MALELSTGGLLNRREAAAYLKVSPHTLANWKSQGRGPRALKVHSLIRYRQAELDAWLEAENSGAEGGAR